jgi:hypothetical protein
MLCDVSVRRARRVAFNFYIARFTLLDAPHLRAPHFARLLRRTQIT